MLKRPKSKEECIEMVKQFPFKKGDTVTVIGKAKSFEDFWQEEWAPEMADFIGKRCKILDLDSEARFGVALDCTESHRDFRFPVYLIDAIEIPKVKLTINDECYIIEVSENSRDILLDNRKDLIRLELQL